MLPPLDHGSRKPRILLADDEAVIAMQIEDLVQAEGYEVAGIAANAAQALDMAVRLRPDLVIMDIVMPGDMDGIDACAIIQRELNIPVVLLSAHGEEKFLRRARAALPSAYLLKPCQNTQIRAAIEVALAMRAHTDPQAGFRLREAHHRIKNSFALLHGLLRMQEVQVSDPVAKGALADAGARVLALARAHEALSATAEDLAKGTGPYIESLAKGLFAAQRPAAREGQGARLRLEVVVDRVRLDPGRLIPCGIFLAEAMTNALKYAFPEGKNGRGEEGGVIRIELAREPANEKTGEKTGEETGLDAGEGYARLCVSDDGVGLPGNPDELGRHSFGLQCMQAAAVQLGGILSIRTAPGEGCAISARFPLED